MSSTAHPGKLWFLGAGPGAADLLTVRAARALAAADVVVWGASLMTDELVAEHAHPDAELVSWPPAEMADIHAVYDRAQAEGLVVARLLWGDPSIYGSLREEVRQANLRGLAYEVVPGVSAACAAAAALGVNLATAPTQSPPLIFADPGNSLRELAGHGAMMAVYMAGKRAGEVQAELMAGGCPPHTPCAVANHVSWGDEVLLTCRLDELGATIERHELQRATLVLVGPPPADGESAPTLGP